MTDSELKQSIVDEEQLRLLSLGYMISAGITGLFSLLGLVYAFMGLVMGSVFSSVTQAGGAAEGAPPAMMGWVFAMFGGLFFLFGAALAVAKFLTGRFLKQRKSPVFCQVVAAVSCLSIPYGTLLGICTFIVLGRRSVAGLFGRS
ncbi:hypothetical protein [Pseudoxanthomonas wuyuanensis]|uniref:Uncharacterized protein n=1 Tax=Pseudoxanthomonas wuyuanensis TaxID=1073196 RepID=A0A286DF24_9GAMM|nr:hypothetical protein [Pseudoxanthomonas wuyuanensis]KAF1719923.1 hypothetical protein CSC75_13455 [Pseudoxanthomonas wuyuanensis]SOD57201.1 hypothetical protein SAMN06296416_11271 [Pseudoxanthomonas wuyuanensis]